MSVELRGEVVIFPHFHLWVMCADISQCSMMKMWERGRIAAILLAFVSFIMTLFEKERKKGCVSISFPADSSTWRGLENIWIGQPQLMQIITLATNPQ